MTHTADVTVLHRGYVGPRTASTVALIRDGAVVVVVDPGMVADHGRILEPLARLDVAPGAVTDIVISHHHPDHTMNIALFPAARVHDFWAIYHGDEWTDRPAEGSRLAPAIQLIETPGHTPEDITTLVGTPDGLVALTHLWWDADGPREDPYAKDPPALHAGRERVLALQPALIVPGHGPGVRSGTHHAVLTPTAGLAAIALSGRTTHAARHGRRTAWRSCRSRRRVGQDCSTTPQRLRRADRRACRGGVHRAVRRAPARVPARGVADRARAVLGHRSPWPWPTRRCRRVRATRTAQPR